MSAIVPAEYLDLLEKPVVVTFATINPDGSPQITPVWCSYDGTHILINSALGRRKDKNIHNNPRVAVLAVDPTNPYRYLEIRGRVVEITQEGAVEHIHQLARKYTEFDRYYGGFAPVEREQQETRVLYKIEPVRVLTH